jgi:hypothetical protein
LQLWKESSFSQFHTFGRQDLGRNVDFSFRQPKHSNNVTLTNALAVSGDGKTIVGTWQDTNFNFGGWMARFQ